MNRYIKEIGLVLNDMDKEYVKILHGFVTRDYITKLEEDENERTNKNSRKVKSPKRAV